ncbi:ANTAR domain-containing protein [Streptomyces sp. NPDC020898]|uniref:ANTAR domain-containing protein n=1 Tax=Streptomyces sp. NPDC020898 TaxID=3365101 RepID=UPI0037B12162
MSHTTVLPEGYWDLKAEATWSNTPPGQKVAALRAENDQLRRALAGRAVIDQARGIVMVLTPCHRGPAKHLLLDVSRRCNVTLQVTAAAVVAAWEGKPLPRQMQQAMLRALQHLHADNRSHPSGRSNKPTAKTRRP